MTHDEQRIYLIRELLREDERYAGMSIPGDESGQKDLLRALMNVRAPEPIAEEFLRVQDEYLEEEIRRIGVTDAADLSPCGASGSICLWQGDITTLRADAIVNAANSGMTGCYSPLHNCIDNIIGSRAGIRLRLYLDGIMRRQGHEEPPGRAKITPGFALPAKYILHTVGPIAEGGVTREHERLLGSCYRSCLDLAAQYGLSSVAFCCISTGVFRFPNRRAAEIAAATVREWLDSAGNGMKVIFDVFRDEDLAIYRELLGA